MSSSPMESLDSQELYVTNPASRQDYLWPESNPDLVKHDWDLEARRKEAAARSYLPEITLVDQGVGAGIALPKGGSRSIARLNDGVPADNDLFNHISTGKVSLSPIELSGSSRPNGITAFGLPVDPAERTTGQLTKPASNKGEQPAQSDFCAGGFPADTTLRSGDLKDLFEQDLGRLDSNGDGFVSSKEIDLAFENPCFTGLEAQLLDVLKEYQNQLEELSNDEYGDENNGITVQDIRELDRLAHADKQARGDAANELINGIDWVFYRSGQSLDLSNHNLFSDTTNPLESISPEAISQGSLGDCYLLSAIGSLAAVNPEVIRDMIEDNKDGTYTVTFPGDPGYPVRISAPTDAELGLFAGGSQFGTWPAVLEKAYGAYFGLTTVPGDIADWGGTAASGVKLLSPGGADLDDLYFSDPAEIEKKLQAALNNGCPVTLGTRQSLSALLGNSDDVIGDAEIPAGHSYSVIGYDPGTQTVTIRNPWGHVEPTNADGTPRDGVNDGTFTMTLEELQANFTTAGYGLP